MLESKRGLWVGRCESITFPWHVPFSVITDSEVNFLHWNWRTSESGTNIRVGKLCETVSHLAIQLWGMLRKPPLINFGSKFKFETHDCIVAVHHKWNTQPSYELLYSTLHWVSPWKKESEKFPCPYVISCKTFNHAKYLRPCFFISPEVPSLPEDSSLLLHLCYCDNNDYLRIKCHWIETLSRGSYERDILQVCTATVCQSSVYFCTQVQSLQKIKKSC